MLRTDKRTYTLTLVEPMLGTVPKDREIYATYIASKAPDGAVEYRAVPVRCCPVQLR